MSVLPVLVVSEYHFPHSRFINALTSRDAFIISCVVLRSFEGVGTAFLTTAVFSTFPVLYPNAVGTLVVSHAQSSYQMQWGR